MKTDRLKLNPDNPRTIGKAEFQRLCESIERDPEFLKLRPIVYDANGTIRAGNQRFKAILQLGWQDIPDDYVRCADTLTEDQMQRFELLDNAPAGVSGQWNDAQLFQYYDADILETLGFDSIQPPELPDVADQIRDEAEYQAERDAAQEKAERIQEQVAKIRRETPEKLNSAAVVILDGRKGNQCLILADDCFNDFIAEVKRHSEAGEESPLAAILDELYPL